jgi:hypothetical protein
MILEYLDVILWLIFIGVFIGWTSWESRKLKTNGYAVEGHPKNYIYEGEFKNGKFQGEGTWIGPKIKEAGQWKKNKRNGHMASFSDGTTYIGEYKNDKKNGLGTFIFSDGMEITGEFKEDKFPQKGTAVFPDGSKYFGKINDVGFPNGFGTFISPKGVYMIIGAWNENEDEFQRGTIIFRKGKGEGDVYVGEIKDDLPNGQGTFYMSNGDQVIGTFRKGNPWEAEAYDNERNFNSEWIEGQQWVDGKLWKPSNNE